MEKRKFPKNFLWGASTSAHQVEGGNHNQWTEWEKLHAGELGRGAEKQVAWMPGWKMVETEAESPANYISGRGVEHYKRYREDFDILGELNMNAFRFGIEWARIEPKEGEWNEKEIAHYRKYINELQKRGIEPIPTLWHWTFPVWFADKGGFEERGNVRYFERFVSKIAAEFGDSLRYVLTLNEPNVYSVISYVSGEWPPQHHNPALGFWVYRNLTRAHKKAYRILKLANPKLMVGLTLNLADMQPVKPGNALNRMLVNAKAYVWNWWFLDRTRDQLDFIGVNYYFTEYDTWKGKVVNPKEPLSDLGWYMEPGAIGRLLDAVWRRYHLPLMITENGLADREDKHRKWWLEQTMEAMQEALGRGIELIGYLHWSLLDNFEWAYGWWPNFGLVSVDRKTMKRTIRPSARWLGTYVRKLSK